jgi:hypothetical protein
MQQCCGEYKTVDILKYGLKWLDSIRRNEGMRTYARNPHELARVLECDTRCIVSGIFLNCSIARKEADNEKLKDGYLFNKLDGDCVESIYKEHRYWLKPPYEDSYLANYGKRKPDMVQTGGQQNG